MRQKLIVISQDALTYEDVEQLQHMPNYQKYLAGGCRVKKVRSIYPTITYPCHTTMITGVWPNKHGIHGNLQLIPGQSKLPWKWFREWVKWEEDIFTVAKRANLTTASIFWPVTGGHPSIDYLIDEYWPQAGDTDIREVFRRAGSSEEVLDIIEAQLKGCKIRTHPDTEEFQMRCAREMILKFQPDLLFMHPGNVDAYRHSKGLFNDVVSKGVEETDIYIGWIMKAVEDAGLLDCTNLVLTSDHGMIDIKRVINVNVLLADAGLIKLNEDGSLKDWTAYCQSGGSQALVYLKDPTDQVAYDRTYQLLKRLASEGIYGFREVYTEPEIDELEHLGGDFAFALETDGYTSFGNSMVRPLVSDYDLSDYRYGRATHGHRPDKGLQPVFVAKGPGFRKNVVLERTDLINEAPTYARLFGLEMPHADGHPLEEFLI